MSAVPHCDHEPRSVRTLPKPRFLAKPAGSFSIAGANPKVVGTLIEQVEVCDDCWRTIEANS